MGGSSIVCAFTVAMFCVFAADLFDTVHAEDADSEMSHVDYRDYLELGVRVETVAKDLEIPWSLDWLPDGTMIFTERTGSLNVLDDVGKEPVQILAMDVGGGEGGLLGVAVDPDFENHSYIYVYYTYQDLFSMYNMVERYQYDVDTGELYDKRTLIDKIPASSWHDGGRIQFGPDGMLYVATGDAIVPDLSQDPASLAGKILRIDRDGSIPEDNPIPDSPVYSMGHRNPQGMDWDSNNILVATEHGPSGMMGIGHDEINLIEPGRNYGWPVVIGDGDGTKHGGDDDDDDVQYTPPIFHTGVTTWAPSGSEFYESRVIPEWNGRYFVSTLFGKSLQMLQFDSEYNVESHAALFSNDFGRLRDVQTGPDGYLYLLTSNRDGRGDPRSDDDRILRILPLYERVDDNLDLGNNHNNNGDNIPRGVVDAIRQRLATFEYDGPETIDTGTLGAYLRHPGYHVSEISFNMSQKSLEFDFERTALNLQFDGHGFDDSSLSIYIERPLLSAPFEVLVYDSLGDIVSFDYDKNNGVADDDYATDDSVSVHNTSDLYVTYGDDHYIVTFEPGVHSGHVTIIGAHVIPEYGFVALGVFATGFVALIFAYTVIQNRRLNDAKPNSKTRLFCAQ